MNQHAVNQYKKARIQTADQGKLVILLYDAVVKSINEAISAIRKNDIESSHNNILKSQKIITELLISLNINEGGEIAKNLQGIYVFINKQLMQANLKKDEKILSDILEMVSNLRDAFKQIILKKVELTAIKNSNENKKINIKV